MVRTRSANGGKREERKGKEEVSDLSSGKDQEETDGRKRGRKRGIDENGGKVISSLNAKKAKGNVGSKSGKIKRVKEEDNAEIEMNEKKLPAKISGHKKQGQKSIKRGTHKSKKSERKDSEKDVRDASQDLITHKIEEEDKQAAAKLDVKVKEESKPGPPKKVGVHVSMSGGMHNSVQNALDLGANAFGLFLRNQRQWAAKPLKDEEAERFKKAVEDAGFSPNSILPHGIYLMNCASPDEETLSKSREALVDELKRCEKLGLTLYNFHPGSTCGKITVDEGIERIAESINRAHKETKYVMTVIENMCCQGHTIGGKFEELRSIIDKVEDKTRIGVCFDTCHAFAAGYDITNKETLDHTMETFENVVGLEYLKAVHLNDSKGNCGCNLDRHENIGHGKIGIKGFKALMNDDRFNDIPMILETPECDYSKEIQKLYSLVSK